MKKFTILTIFPDIFTSYLSKSIPKIAQEKKLVNIEIVNIREYPSQQIDDYAFGGGPGMVFKIEPIVTALKKHNLTSHHIILLTPRGTPLSQSKVIDLSKLNKDIVILCGHYEGIDERITHYITEEISIGDFVLSSGELPAMVLLDSIIRLLPGVINSESLKTESFNDYLLDFPVYTRPQVFEGYGIPEVLLSGNHKKIKEFREQQRLEETKKRRPELYKLFLSKNS